MAYNHDICLQQEVLNEYCAEILGFIYRNYLYEKKELPENIAILKAETIKIKSALMPQEEIEPLYAFEDRLIQIFKEVKETTPFPHR